MSRRGFTLVELLVVVTIIAMLAAIMMGAVHTAKQSAREAATRSTISKLDAVIRDAWEEFPSRRLPVKGPDFALLSQIWNQSGPHPAGAPTPLDIVRGARENFRRDLWRMEMPDRWPDVIGPALKLPDGSYPLRDEYRRRYQWALQTLTAPPPGRDLDTPDAIALIKKWEQAETLYMVVMAHGGNRIKWRDNEVADRDNDGLKEFVDAWGLPLMWLRWPSGWPGEPGMPDSGNGYVIEGLGPYPLILSAGRDGLYDVNRGVEASGETFAYGIDAFNNLNPWTTDENSPPMMIGTPIDATGPRGEPANGSLDHHDSLTNRDVVR